MKQLISVAIVLTTFLKSSAQCELNFSKQEVIKIQSGREMRKGVLTNGDSTFIFFDKNLNLFTEIYVFGQNGKVEQEIIIPGEGCNDQFITYLNNIKGASRTATNTWIIPFQGITVRIDKKFIPEYLAYGFFYSQG